MGNGEKPVSSGTSRHARTTGAQISRLSSFARRKRASGRLRQQARPLGAESLEPRHLLDGDVVVSEVMYHPLSHDPQDEWIELYNRSDEAIDLTGYRFSAGVDYLFPDATTIEPDGYLVVAANVDAFNLQYPGVTNVVGGWTGQLSNGGEQIRLRNGFGTVVDELDYADDGDFAQQRRLQPIETDVVNIVGACGGAQTLEGWVWESPHDGEGSSLEVINSHFTNDLAHNWGTSTTSGTPGAPNSVAASDIAPSVSDVAHSPIIPKSDEAVTITARISDDMNAVVNPTLHYRISTNNPPPFTQVAMFDDGLHGDGAAGDGIYGAEVPAQADDAVVEFYVSASDEGGLTRTYPAPSDDQGGQDANMLYQVDDTDRPEDLLLYRVIMTVPERQQFEQFDHRCSDAQRNSTIIATSGSGVTFRYNAGVRFRGSDSRGSTPANYRFNFPSDRPLFGNTAMNINGNNEEDQVAGSALWALAGEPAADAWAVRMFQNNTDPSNGRYFAQVEVTNSDWARRHFPNDSQGNYYRGRRANEGPPGGRGASLTYFGEETLPYTSYLKGTNESLANWDDIIQLTRSLDPVETPDDVFLETLSEIMDIDQWLKGMALSELTGYNEFGLFIGDSRGDDWALYSGVNDPRFVFVPYDMDTMFEGRTGSIYSAESVPALSRLLNAPGVWQRFYQQFLDVMEILTADNVGPHLTQLLGTVESERTINTWVNFLRGRADFVNGVIEQELTANSTMTDAGGVYTTNNATSGRFSGNAHAAKTHSVVVNGLETTYNARNATWTISDVPLDVGLNRVLIQALDANGEEVERLFVDVYREGATTNVSGTISADTTWTTAASPYVVTGEVTVSAGATLTIEPGVAVLFQPGTRMRVQGRLSAVGTESNLIRFTRDPLSGGEWDGIQFQNTMEDNQIHWATLQWGITGDGMLGVQNSKLEVDSVSFDNTNRRRIRSRDSSLIVRNSTFSSIVDTIDNQSEHIWGGGIPDGGHFVVDNNVFGSITGHNDSVDFDSPRAPSPITRITNNVFMGGGDDALDMTGDNWIEGNIFRNFIKDEVNTDPGESNTISSSSGTFYVVRNVFENIQHAALIKENAFMHFHNNTVMNSEFGALYFDLPGQTSGPGRGADIQGNIFQNVATAIDLTFPPREGVTVDYTLLPKDELGLGETNRAGLAAVVDLENGDFTLLDGSGGQGTGRNGTDMGAAIPSGALLTGEPATTTRSDSATLLVSGAGITHYRYQLNDGEFSAETPVESPIELTGLSDGTYVVRVIGKNLLGEWQEIDDANASRPWTVDSTVSRLVINEVLASNDQAFALDNGSHPDFIEIFNDSNTTVSLGGMSLSDDAEEPRKFVFPTGTEVAAGGYFVVYLDTDDGSPGVFTNFTLSREGESVSLYESPGNGGVLVDTISFGMQATDWSLGRDRDDAWTVGIPSPGAANTSVISANPSLLTINEWLAIPDVNFPNDFIEIYNPLSTPVDASGLFLTDNATGWPDRHEIPAHTYIAAEGLALFIADGDPGDGPDHVDFGLNPRMETIAIHDADLNQIDMVRYTPQHNDVSEGRSPNGGEAITRFSLPNPLVNNPGSVDVSVQPILNVTDVWRYDESGADPGPQWSSVDFDDNDWLEGGGLLYVESSDLPAPKTTPLTLGSTTYYFRKTFSLDVDLSIVEEVLVTAYVDDGFAMYVNGVEVQRIGMPAGPLDSTTLALRTVGNASGDNFTLPVDAFVEGENTIAVEVHQTNTDSSDIVFGLAMDFRLATEATSTADERTVNNLRISEVMYNPLGGSGFEFVELHNIGDRPLDLNGVRLDDAVEFTFSDVTLGPDEYIVVTNNSANFRSRYGDDVRVAGDYEGSLANGDERIRLVLPEPSLVTVLDFRYQDDWYPETDGDGFSLVTSDSLNPRGDWDNAGGWRASNFVNGSPGGEDIGLEAGILVINEVSTTPGNVAIEIQNTISSPLDLSGWYLSDSATGLTNYQIADGTTIGANGLAVFTQTDFGESIGLSRDGGEVFLASPDATPSFAGFIASITYGAIDTDTSFGRYTTSDGRVEIVEQTTATIGSPNSGPRVGPLVVNEVMYRPANGSDEYIELKNTSDTEIDLSGYRLAGENAIDFGAETVAANGYALVVGIAPAEFRSRYNIPADVAIAGPYAGLLNDSTADIRLERRAADSEAWLLVEHVEYASQAPWPAPPINVNASINRIDANTFGNDPINWSVSIVDGTPGAPNRETDTTPPTTPTEVSASLIDGNSAEITWTAATDPETEIATYRVYRDGLAIADIADTRFVDDTATGPAVYTYSISAINAQGLESSQSAVETLSVMSVLSVTSRFETELVIRFTDSVTAASAEDLANYTIDGLAITAATLGRDGQVVTLATDPMEQNVDYTLTIRNVVGETSQFPPSFVTNFQFQEGVPGFTVTSRRSLTPIRTLLNADTVLNREDDHVFIIESGQGTYRTINFIDVDGHAHDGLFDGDVAFPHNQFVATDNFVIRAIGVITVSEDQAGDWTFGASVAKPDGEVTELNVIGAATEWKYHDLGIDQGTAWREPGFDDSSWEMGPGQLGYGDGDEATVISFGGDPGNKYPTYYFRNTFEIADASAIREMSGTIVRDDAAAVYVNGVEVYRSNLVDGADYSTFATNTTGNENSARPFSFDPSLIIDGTNTIAVEVHQGDPDSSDVSFDMRLSAFAAGEGISDDGFRLLIDGVPVLNADSQHTSADRLGTITLTPGTHEAEFVFFESSGEAEVELFAAQGAFESLDATDTWRLVGDTANSGLSVVTLPEPPKPIEWQPSGIPGLQVFSANAQATLSPSPVSFETELVAGHSITAFSSGEGAIITALRNGATLATSTDATIGFAVLDGFVVPETGTYRFEFTTTDTNSFGFVQFELNTQIEDELIQADAENSSPETADNLDDAFGEIAAGVERVTLLGTFDGESLFFTESDTLDSSNVISFEGTPNAPPMSTGLVEISAFGNLEQSFEFLSININDILFEDIFVDDGQDEQFVSTLIELSADQVQQIAAEGQVRITINPSFGVDPVDFSSVNVSMFFPDARGDHYGVTLEADEMLTVYSNSPAVRPTFIDILDPNGRPLVSATQSDFAAIIRNFRAETAGEYFIRVRGNTASSGYFVTALREADLSIGESSSSNAADISHYASVVGGITNGAQNFYDFAVTVGDVVTVSTETPPSGASNQPNTLDPVVTIFNSVGQSIATDSNSLDGRNATITFTAADTGTYTVAIGSESGDGAFVLRLDGNAVTTESFEVVSTVPSDGETIEVATTDIVIDFSSPINAATLSPDSIIINGQPAASVRLLNETSAAFEIPDSADGQFTFEVLPGIQGLAGGMSSPTSGTFVVDTGPPQIVSTLWNGQPYLGSLASGPFSVALQFNELIDSSVLDVSDLQLFNFTQGELQSPQSFTYDEQTFTLSAFFENVDEGSYQFSAFSRDDGIRDSIGNLLDGEFNFQTIDGTITGDGTEGGDYNLFFTVEGGPQSADQLFTVAPPFGSSSYTALLRDTVSYFGDTDPHTFELAAGETLEIVMPAFGISGFDLRDTNNNLIANAERSGSHFRLQPQTISSSGIYTVNVFGVTQGVVYDLQLTRNAGLEFTDSTIVDPFSLSLVGPGGTQTDAGGSRAFVIGSTKAVAPNTLLYGIQPETGQIVVINPDNGTIVNQFPTPDAISPDNTQISLASSDGGLTLTYWNGDVDPTTVYTLLPDSGEVLNTETILDGVPENDYDATSASDADRRFVLQGGVIHELDPTQPGTFLSDISAPAFDIEGLAFDTKTLYASTSSGLLYLIDPAGTTTNQQTTTIVAAHSDSCLDVAGISLEDGANIQQWSCWDSGNQRFTLAPVDAANNEYLIVAEHSALCMEVPNSSLGNGTSVRQATCDGDANQTFRIEASGFETYQIVASHSDKCVDISEVSTEDGANAIQWDCHGQSNQQFRLTLPAIQDITPPRSFHVPGGPLYGLAARTVLGRGFSGVVVETEPNNEIATAQLIDGSFNLDEDPNIEDSIGVNTSTQIPHARIEGTGDGTLDYFQFTASADSKAIFDIDETENLDAYLKLYDSAGTLLFESDDFNQDTGSNTTLDSFLEITLPNDGTYFIEVGSFPDGSVVNSGATYTLNVSIENTPLSSLTETQLISSGDAWRYLDDGSDQGTAWFAADFDDAAWATGASQLGYGDGDEVTTIGFGGNPDAKVTTTYFRRTFDILDSTAIEELTLRLLRDDGAAVYLNGAEVVRDNLVVDAQFDTFAQGTTSGNAEDTFNAFTLDPNLLVNGTNVIAVEVHQASLTSSDLSFDLTLDAVSAANSFEFSESPDVDFYSLDMTGRTGEDIDVALYATSPSDDTTGVTIQLVAPDGKTIVAEESSERPNETTPFIAAAILGHTLAESGEYTIRVIADSDIDYHLATSENSVLDLEPFDTIPDRIRSLDHVDGAQGHLSAATIDGTFSEDPANDTVGIADVLPDIASLHASVVGENLELSVTYHTEIPTSKEWFSYIELDLDQDFATGESSLQNTIGPMGQRGGPIGVDRRVLIFPGSGEPGTLIDNQFNPLGSLPLIVGTNSVELAIPLSLLGDGQTPHNGDLDLVMVSGLVGETLAADAAPDSTVISVSATEANEDDPQDVFSLQMQAGDTITLETRTPLGELGSGINPLNPSIEIRSVDGTVLASDLSSADDAHNAKLQFTAATSDIYHVVVLAEENAGEYQLNLTRDVVTQPDAEISGRYVFYNNSVFDNNEPSAGLTDDAALALDKQPLLPGETATFENYTSFDKGINGIMIDVAGLAGTPTISDFEFRVGNSSELTTWTTAPEPMILRRAGAGVNNSDRIVLIWDDAAIANQWLQVTMLANETTRLSSPDVFYFGNAIGESGDSTSDTKVNATDEVGARNNPHTFVDPASIDDRYDFNRDQRVNATDEIIARNNATTFVNELVLLSAPTSAQGEIQEPANADLLNALARMIARNQQDPAMDFNADGIVDYGDLTATLASIHSLPGDANLDGQVDDQDLSIWSNNRFTVDASYTTGDFDANGLVDGADFSIWNTNRLLRSAVLEAGDQRTNRAADRVVDHAMRQLLNRRQSRAETLEPDTSAPADAWQIRIDELLKNGDWDAH